MAPGHPGAVGIRDGDVGETQQPRCRGDRGGGIGECLKTKSGDYMLSRVRRGRHPRWKDHTVAILEPMLWGSEDE